MPDAVDGRLWASRTFPSDFPSGRLTGMAVAQHATQSAGPAVVGGLPSRAWQFRVSGPYRGRRCSHVHRNEPLQGRAWFGSGLRESLDVPRQPFIRRAGFHRIPSAAWAGARRPRVVFVAHDLAKPRRLRGLDTIGCLPTRTQRGRREPRPVSRSSRIRRLRRDPGDRAGQQLIWRCAMRFDGKIGLITGAGSGIGRATAIGFAQRGGTAVIADVNGDGVDAVAGEIAAFGGTASAVVADMAKAADIDAMVAHAVEKFGRLDVLHNNAFGVPAT